MYYLKLARVIKKYNLILFVLLVFAGLVIIVLSVANIIGESVVISPQTPSSTASGSVQLDFTTIDKINVLNAPSSAPNATVPSGRTNPFGEQ